MAAKHARHIALTAPLIAYVEEQVAKGDYTSVSEVVRSALRLLIAHDAEKSLRVAAPTGSAHVRA